MNDDLVKLAEEYCRHFHRGQFRKGSNLPYHTHPLAVTKILDKYGYSDPVTKCISLLHDVVEDTEVITGEIKDRFGYEISNGVFILSKNTISDQIVDLLERSINENLSKDQMYKLRLSFARKTVKRIKIADMVHNTQDLISLKKPSSIERKLNDAENFYIPMGKKVAPLMVRELEENIANYRKIG